MRTQAPIGIRKGPSLPKWRAPMRALRPASPRNRPARPPRNSMWSSRGASPHPNMSIKETRMKRPSLPTPVALALSLALGAVAPAALHAHEGAHFSAGQPGDPKKPARTIEVIMKEEYGAMEYVPNRIEVKRNEQIRFVLKNSDNQTHEFILASTADN